MARFPFVRNWALFMVFSRYLTHNSQDFQFLSYYSFAENRRAYRPNNTSCLYSALHSPNLRAHLSHTPENLRTQSPWGKPVFPYIPNYRAFSFPFIFLFFISRPAVSPPVLLPFVAMSWWSLVSYAAILSRPFMFRAFPCGSPQGLSLYSSFYTVPSFPEVF